MVYLVLHPRHKGSLLLTSLPGLLAYLAFAVEGNRWWPLVQLDGVFWLPLLVASSPYARRSNARMRESSSRRLNGLVT